MRVWFVSMLLFPVVLLGHIASLDRVNQKQREMLQAGQMSQLLPGPVMKVMSLEFDQLMADLLFIKTISFYGERVGRGTPLQEDEWDQMVSAMNTISDLDPYFLDVYLFGETTLVWHAGRVQEANRLLEKGRRHRTGDWHIPFYLGFNYFYFLHDSQKGAFYMMEASRLPGRRDYLPLLAARLSQEAGQTEAAVIFLQELYDQTWDFTMKQNIKKRLEAMKSIFVLEKGIIFYQEKFGNSPSSLDLMVSRGILKKLPEDPYGGEFYMDELGKVKTTSRMDPE